MADKINAAGYETKPWWPYVRALMEGGGNVTVEQLNVTENGTYTAEAGKAYSPVVVNVPAGITDIHRAVITAEFSGNTNAFKLSISPSVDDGTVTQIMNTTFEDENGFIHDIDFAFESEVKTSAGFLFKGNYAYFVPVLNEAPVQGQHVNLSGNAELIQVTYMGTTADLIKANGDFTVSITSAQ